jgi:hypothetical protein
MVIQEALAGMIYSHEGAGAGAENGHTGSLEVQLV